jgi:hypothetical protein
MPTSELLIVKLTDGTTVLFRLGNNATVDASLKVADRVEAHFTPDHHVISVKRLTADIAPLNKALSP